MLIKFKLGLTNRVWAPLHPQSAGHHPSVHLLQAWKRKTHPKIPQATPQTAKRDVRVQDHSHNKNHHNPPGPTLCSTPPDHRQEYIREKRDWWAMNVITSKSEMGHTSTNPGAPTVNYRQIEAHFPSLSLARPHPSPIWFFQCLWWEIYIIRSRSCLLPPQSPFPLFGGYINKLKKKVPKDPTLSSKRKRKKGKERKGEEEAAATASEEAQEEGILSRHILSILL